MVNYRTATGRNIISLWCPSICTIDNGASTQYWQRIIVLLGRSESLDARTPFTEARNSERGTGMSNPPYKPINALRPNTKGKRKRGVKNNWWQCAQIDIHQNTTNCLTCIWEILNEGRHHDTDMVIRNINKFLFVPAIFFQLTIEFVCRNTYFPWICVIDIRISKKKILHDKILSNLSAM